MTIEIGHAISTLLMVGVIWMVQLVHYPLFARVGRDAFHGYERAHVQRISWLVVPLMLVELTTAIGLVLDSSWSRGEAWTGLALLIAIWATTFFVQVPLHDRLGRAFDEVLVRRLVRTNWIRTVLWTARGCIVALTLEH